VRSRLPNILGGANGQRQDYAGLFRYSQRDPGRPNLQRAGVMRERKCLVHPADSNRRCIHGPIHYADGQIAALIPAVIVNSSTLNPADFVVALGSAPDSLVVTYAGVAKTFAPATASRWNYPSSRRAKLRAEQSLFNSLRRTRITLPFQPSCRSRHRLPASAAGTAGTRWPPRA